MNWLLVLAKPFLKAAINKAVDAETEILKTQIKDKLANGGVTEVDHLIDLTQVKLVDFINNHTPGWSWVLPYKVQVLALVNDHTDAWQKQLDAQLLAQGPAAVDSALDQASAFLKSKIALI